MLNHYKILIQYMTAFVIMALFSSCGSSSVSSSGTSTQTNNNPTITGSPTSVMNYTENRTIDVIDINAIDVDADTITYSLTG
ncbi:MAG: hypothetical protein B1H07_04115, partial [Campylobacteraceae bacterium 4484_166]